MVGVYYNAMILELCVTHLTMCAWVQMMNFCCRTYYLSLNLPPPICKIQLIPIPQSYPAADAPINVYPSASGGTNQLQPCCFIYRPLLSSSEYGIYLPIYECHAASRTEAILFNSVTTAETVRSCAGINIKQSKPLLAVAVQLQENVSSNQFHSQGINMSQEVAGGVV